MIWWGRILGEVLAVLRQETAGVISELVAGAFGGVGG
jgi:hypothetical protein